MNAPSTRRGFLGLIAAAIPATAIAAPAMTAPAKPAPEDWQTKPVDQWTKLDFLAEADYHIAHIKAQTAEYQDTEMRRTVHGAMLGWWEREREVILKGIAGAVAA